MPSISIWMLAVSAATYYNEHPRLAASIGAVDAGLIAAPHFFPAFRKLTFDWALDHVLYGHVFEPPAYPPAPWTTVAPGPTISRSEATLQSSLQCAADTALDMESPYQDATSATNTTNTTLEDSASSDQPQEMINPRSAINLQGLLDLPRLCIISCPKYFKAVKNELRDVIWIPSKERLTAATALGARTWSNFHRLPIGTVHQPVTDYAHHYTHAIWRNLHQLSTAAIHEPLTYFDHCTQATWHALTSRFSSGFLHILDTMSAYTPNHRNRGHVIIGFPVAARKYPWYIRVEYLFILGTCFTHFVRHAIQRFTIRSKSHQVLVVSLPTFMFALWLAQHTREGQHFVSFWLGILAGWFGTKGIDHFFKYVLIGAWEFWADLKSLNFFRAVWIGLVDILGFFWLPWSLRFIWIGFRDVFADLTQLFRKPASMTVHHDEKVTGNTVFKQDDRPQPQSIDDTAAPTRRNRFQEAMDRTAAQAKQQNTVIAL